MYKEQDEFLFFFDEFCLSFILLFQSLRLYPHDCVLVDHKKNIFSFDRVKINLPVKANV